MTKKKMTARQRLARIADILETVDQRALAVDGPVPPTRKEISTKELLAIYTRQESAMTCSRCGAPRPQTNLTLQDDGTAVCPECLYTQATR